MLAQARQSKHIWLDGDALDRKLVMCHAGGAQASIRMDGSLDGRCCLRFSEFVGTILVLWYLVLEAWSAFDIFVLSWVRRFERAGAHTLASLLRPGIMSVATLLRSLPRDMCR